VIAGGILVERSGGALWVHGHTHDSFEYRIAKTRVICNPNGPGRVNVMPENLAFDPRLLIDIEAG
jgi:hypothetical protein